MDYEANRKELANRLVEVQFAPVEGETPLQDNNSTTSFPLGKIAEYGGGAASIFQALQGIAEASKTSGQLYQCVFPNGAAGGVLAQAKDFGNLGAILKDGSIVGQARWVPVAGTAAGASVATIAPAVIFVTAMTMQINKKVDHLQKTADEILGFLETDKQAHMKADLQILTEITNTYSLNFANEPYIQSRLVQVGNIKHEALANIDFYKTPKSANSSTSTSPRTNSAKCRGSSATTVLLFTSTPMHRSWISCLWAIIRKRQCKHCLTALGNAKTVTKNSITRASTNWKKAPTRELTTKPFGESPMPLVS